MSLLVLGTASMVAGAMLMDAVDKSKSPLSDTVPERKTVVERELYTGRYGTNEMLMHVLNDPTQIVGAQDDVDLSGVPFCWVLMRNGAKYQVYGVDRIHFLNQLRK